MSPRDDDELRRLGYAPKLRRSLDPLASLSIAFSYISPVVGVYTLFGYGLSTGGPAYIWSLPIVRAGLGVTPGYQTVVTAG